MKPFAAVAAGAIAFALVVPQFFGTDQEAREEGAVERSESAPVEKQTLVGRIFAGPVDEEADEEAARAAPRRRICQFDADLNPHRRQCSSLKRDEPRSQQAAYDPEPDEDEAEAEVEAEEEVQRSRTVRIKRDTEGHFSLTAELNGRPTKVLVDTGASAVAINESTARRIGIRVSDSDFSNEATTANGRTKYAIATINNVRIEGIYVRQVPAAVLRDDALEDVLLGMSFLNRLNKVEMQGKTLTLER